MVGASRRAPTARRAVSSPSLCGSYRWPQKNAEDGFLHTGIICVICEICGESIGAYRDTPVESTHAHPPIRRSAAHG